MQASRRSNVAIYFLDTRGLEGLPFFGARVRPRHRTPRTSARDFVDSLQEAEGAESLASDSGGFTVKNTNDLGAGIKRIADESRSYYLLGYNPTNTARDGQFRKIQVKVAGARAPQVRARKGYYAPLRRARARSTAKKRGRRPRSSRPRSTRPTRSRRSRCG